MASKKLVVGEVEVIDGDPPISNFFAWLKMRAKRAGVEVFKVGNNPFLFRCSSEEELEKLIEIGVVEVGQCKFVYRKQQGKRLSFPKPQPSSFPCETPLQISCHESQFANVLIVGKTGTGKTTFVETLKNPEYYAPANVKSDTQEPEIHRLCFQVNSSFYNITLVDTPGFSDSSHKTDHSIQTHIEDFVKQGVTSLSMVLLAVPTNEVIDQNHIDTLFDTMNFLSHMKNITYILGTRAEGKTKEEKRRWAMELNTHPSLSHVVKFTKGKFVWGGMIDKDVSPETKRKWVQNLRENHGDFLKRAMEGGHIPLVDETARENENFAYFESAMKYHRNLEQMLRKIPPLLEEYRRSLPPGEIAKECYDRRVVEKKIELWKQQQEMSMYFEKHWKMKVAAQNAQDLYTSLFQDLKELKGKGIFDAEEDDITELYI